jgi:hypothetical protein
VVKHFIKSVSEISAENWMAHTMAQNNENNLYLDTGVIYCFGKAVCVLAAEGL